MSDWLALLLAPVRRGKLAHLFPACVAFLTQISVSLVFPRPRRRPIAHLQSNMDRRSVGRAPSPSRSTSPRLASESVVSARARGFSSHLDSLPGAGLGGSRRYSAGAISPREATSGNFPFSFYNTPTPAPASPPNRLGNPYSEPITLASRGQQSPQSYDQAQSPLPRRSSLGGGGKPYERQQRPDSLAHHSQGRVHHQGFQQSVSNTLAFSACFEAK